MIQASGGRPARVAVVLAGGVGARMGIALPKQLIRLGGITILERTIAVFDAHPDVERVIVMMTPTHLEEARSIASAYEKVSEVLPGADTRNGTTLAALAAIPDDDARVLFHDAVRPLVDDRIIAECYAELEHHRAVDVAIPTADTIVEVDAAGIIRSIPDRSTLRRGQTPQGFHAGVLRAAYDVAQGDPDFAATDDCGVVLRYLPDVPIKVVMGAESNLKVTEPVDVALAERILALGDTDLREQIAREHP